MNLAESLRPLTLSDVIGNTHITKPLLRQLETGTLSQSLLLHGSFGTGKTTIVRCLATALNADVTELDCGSDGGIDKIRSLVVDSSRYSSLVAPKKLFVLDEVHQLSAAAFTALLKTLEDDNPDTHFVLLTTELKKIPKTIVSRCVVYETLPASNVELGEAIKRVMNKYSLAFENKKDLWAIVEASEGSYRMAYSHLEKLVAVAETLPIIPTTVPSTWFTVSPNVKLLVSSQLFMEVIGERSLPYIDENLPKAVISKDALKVFGILSKYEAEGKQAFPVAKGIYSYLKKVYLGNGTGIDPYIMSGLSSLMSTKSVTYLDLENIVWEMISRTGANKEITKNE